MSNDYQTLEEVCRELLASLPMHGHFEKGRWIRGIMDPFGDQAVPFANLTTAINEFRASVMSAIQANPPGHFKKGKWIQQPGWYYWGEE
jgi:hypothetical protein